MARMISCAAMVAVLALSSAPSIAQPHGKQDPARPWLNEALSAEQRAKAAVAALTVDEKLRLIFGFSDQAVTEVSKVPDELVPPDIKTAGIARAVKGSAGFVPGVPRLGIPDQTQTDASMGVRNSFIPSTALPTSLATAANINPEVPRADNTMIGAGARAARRGAGRAGGGGRGRGPREGRD